MKPYILAYQQEREMEDERLWRQGYYFNNAMMAVMAQFGAGLAGKHTDVSYMDKPLYMLHKENNTDRELTEDEVRLEVDKFFAEEAARRSAWRAKHSNKTE